MRRPAPRVAALALVAVAWTVRPATAGTFMVTTTADSGAGSLRQAILDANADVDPDDIAFAIDTGPQTISPTSAFPDVTSPVTIDGTTQPGFAGSPIVEIEGSSAPAGASGLVLDSHTGSTVRGLVINRFTDLSQVGGNGIVLSGGGGHTIEGNYLGLDLAGTSNLGNARFGIACQGCSTSTIGGTTAAQRNLISANASGGILIQGGTGNLVEGNWIGLAISGSVSLGNGIGVFILSAGSVGSTGNLVGGDLPAAANVISSNGIGVNLGNQESTGNTVKGNLIGTDVTGTIPLGNTSAGISVNSVPSVTIDGNTIADSGDAGIRVFNALSDGIVVRSNRIGTDVTGTVAMGNGTGVRVAFGPQGAPTAMTIGGTGTGNLIAHNTGAGVEVVSGLVGMTLVSPTGIDLRDNAIFANGGLGIDLEADGVTANDAGDADVGANDLQNFPVVTDVVDMGDMIEFIGTLDAVADTTYRIELFESAAADPSGNGEGESPLGIAMVTTDGTGHGVLDVMLGVAVGAGSFVTATATDPGGNTSEFGPAFLVAGPTTTSTPPTTAPTTSSTSPSTTTTGAPTTSTSSTLESTTTSVGATTSSTSTTSTTGASTTSTPVTTSSTSTASAPVTTSSTSTVTTSSTTTSTPAPSTSSTSTTQVPTTSTTGPAPTTTTTTPAPTTSSTLPPCANLQPVESVACRINLLATRVDREGQLGAVQGRLAVRIGRAETAVELARELCVTAKTAAAKRRLRKVGRALAQSAKVLKSKKAGGVPPALRADLTTTVEGLRGDIGLLKIALVCP